MILSDITEAVPYFFGDDVLIETEVETDVLSIETSQTVLIEVLAMVKVGILMKSHCTMHLKK